MLLQYFKGNAAIYSASVERITALSLCCRSVYRAIFGWQITMRIQSILYNLAILFLLIQPGAALGGEIDPLLPMRLRAVMVHEFDPALRRDYFIADVDNDRDDDLLLEGRNGVIWFRIKDGQLTTIDEGQFKAVGKIIGVHDVTGDGVPEIFFNVPTSEGNIIYCHDWFSKSGSKKPLYTLGPYHKPLERDNNYGEGSIAVADCRDIDKDGRSEIYMFFNTFQREPYPRSLRVFDGPTGSELHRFDMGPQLSWICFLEEPGREPRIILSTFAVNNGAVWNGTADSLSYVFCLYPDLKLNWKQTVAGKATWSNTVVGDIDNDGAMDILVTRKFGSEEKDKSTTGDTWSVRRLDPYNGGRTVRECALYIGTDHPLLADLDRDGRKEILVVGQDYCLYILDHDLSVLKKIDSRLHDILYRVADLDRDGSKEIICSGAGMLLIYDSTGDLKAETPFNPTETTPKLEIATAEGNIYIAAINNQFLNFYTYEKNPLSAQISEYIGRFRMFKEGISFLLLIGIIIGLTSSWFLLRSRTRGPGKDDETAKSIEANEELLNAMTAFGHGGASLRVINRLRFYVTNWERAMNGGEDQKRTFDDLVSSYTDSILPELKRIMGTAKKAGFDRQCLQEMLDNAEQAPDLLLRLVTFRADIDEGKSSTIIALKALDALDQGIAAIRDHLQSVFLCPVVSATLRSISRRGEELEQLGIEPNVTFTGIEKEHAFVSPHVFEKVMDNLVLNAIRAMENHTDADLDIAIAPENNYFQIDVMDSGCGIPEQDKEKVFDRQYSTKPEGGFGLHYAREELARFGGKIFVKESSLGGGTIFRIILKQS